MDSKLDSQLGHARVTHPLPLRLRNPFVSKDQGGSMGYRGPGYQEIRKRILFLGGYRSTVTGLPRGEVTLQTDHICPYRIGGLSPHTNHPTNLRISDNSGNKFIDYAEGFQEKPAVRRMRAF